MAKYVLRPNADNKADWTEVPTGAGWSCVDDAVSSPSVPSTSDRLESLTHNQTSAVQVATYTVDRQIQRVTAYTYLKPGDGGTQTALVHTSGGTTTLAAHSTYGTVNGIHLGVNEDYNWYYANGGHAAGAPVVKNMGGTCARVPVYWFNHQFSSGGAYNWTTYAYPQGAYDAILAAGLLPILCVLGAPDYAGAPSGYGGLRICDTAHIPDFADFVEALQTEFPQALIQVWNEPNYTLFGNGASASHLAAMTNAASQAIQPNEIIAPAMSPGGEQEASAYFNTMWDAITQDTYVKAAAHIYPGPSGWTTDISNWLTRLNQRSPGRGWITECGIHQANHGGATNQNTRSKVMYQMASDAGLEGIIYHRFRTSHDTTWETNGDFGIVNYTLSGANFVTNDLYTALADARDDDPNLGGTTATYRWVTDTYAGSLTQAQVDALQVWFTRSTTGSVKSEVACAYIEVEDLPPTVSVPPQVVADPLPAGAAQQGFQRVTTKVEVLKTNAWQADLETVTGGQVTFDAKAAARGRLDSLTLTDDGTMGLVPTGPDSLLAPFGNELRISRGVQVGGTTYLTQLGIFTIERTEVRDAGEGYEITVSGLDRSLRVMDASFEKPYVVASGTLAHDAVYNLVHDVYPEVSMTLVTSGITLPGLMAEEGSDRWDFATGIAQVMGCELFFDSYGGCVLRPIPVPGTVAASYVEGDGGVLLSIDRGWDRGETYNKVIVTGESSQVDGAVPRGEAYDNDVNSPTVWGGPFGRKPYFWANQYIKPTLEDPTGNLAATVAAKGLLQRVMGLPSAISFGAVVDPERRPGDTVYLERTTSVQPAGEVHILDTVTIPLGVEDSMSATTRVAQVLISG